MIVGASGGIGAALVSALLADHSFSVVHALSRSCRPGAEGKLRRIRADITDLGSIERAAEALEGKIRLATGVLHGGWLQPERTYRALDGESLLESYRVNAIRTTLAVSTHALSED